MPMPQPKNISIIWHWIICNEPSPTRLCSSFWSPHFVAVFLLPWSTFLCPHHDVAVGKYRWCTPHYCLIRVLWSSFPYSSPYSFLTPKQLQDFLFVLHGIYPTSLRIIIYKRHKVIITSNRCCLDRSPNIYVNIIKNFLAAMNRGAVFHLGLPTDDAMLTKCQLKSLDTLQRTLLC